MKTPLSTAIGQWIAIISAVVIALAGLTFYLLSVQKHPRLQTIATQYGSDRYVTDGDYIYDNGKLLVGAQAESFKVFENEDFAADESRVYYKDLPLLNADPSTFEVLDRGQYAKDSLNVYYGSKKMTADSGTFDVINISNCNCSSESDYAKDKTTVYYLGKAITGSNSSAFTLLSNYYSMDDHAVYYGSNIVQGADLPTFVIESSDSYYSAYPSEESSIMPLVRAGTINTADKYITHDAKDKNHLYYKGIKVK